MPCLIQEQGSREWHDAHLLRLSSSVAGACLGVDPYCSRQKAYRKIIGTEVEKDHAALRYGRENEDRCRFAYECEKGVLVEQTGFWVHPTLNWLGASPDGLVEEDGLFEGKCLAHLPRRISPQYLIQMQVQMFVCQRQWCDFFVWHPDDGTWHRRLHALPHAGQMALVNRLAHFYREYVKKRVEPPRKKPRRRSREKSEQPGGNASVPRSAG